jgi:hypothetical protein
MAGVRGGGVRIYFNVFIGYVQPINILLYSSIPRNIMTYIHRCYIPCLFHRLTKELILYPSVLEVYSSVVNNKYFMVSCSDS